MPCSVKYFFKYHHKLKSISLLQ